MSKTFEYNLIRRITNRVLISLLRIDTAPDYYHLLTVKGRITGNPHSVPVVVIYQGGKKYLVAPYGEVDWVKNARRGGLVNLMHQKQSNDYSISEVSPEDAAPILKEYYDKFPITKEYFDVPDQPLINDFLLEADTKPVFELFKI